MIWNSNWDKFYIIGKLLTRWEWWWIIIKFHIMQIWSFFQPHLHNYPLRASLEHNSSHRSRILKGVEGRVVTSTICLTCHGLGFINVLIGILISWWLSLNLLNDSTWVISNKCFTRWSYWPYDICCHITFLLSFKSW